MSQDENVTWVEHARYSFIQCVKCGCGTIPQPGTLSNTWALARCRSCGTVLQFKTDTLPGSGQEPLIVTRLAPDQINISIIPNDPPAPPRATTTTVSVESFTVAAQAFSQAFQDVVDRITKATICPCCGTDMTRDTSGDPPEWFTQIFTHAYVMGGGFDQGPVFRERMQQAWERNGKNIRTTGKAK